MSRAMKAAIVGQIRQTLEGQDSLVLVDESKLTVEENQTLREELRKEDIRLFHLRNRLAGIAFEEQGFQGLKDLLAGPVAMAFGGEGAIAISKIVMEQAKKLKALKVIGGFIDGKVIDPAGVETLSKMPGRKELQSMVLQGFFGPVSDFHASMENLFTEVHGLLEALETKKTEEG
ncbi:MAG TPA: 50S ribosomal protein L10 [Planctomycetes bacterium]|nr:50S ribosomal protein L10 [Planctomycetota bacterium]